MTAITLKQAVDRLTVPQLTDLGEYIQRRIAEIEASQLMRDVVQDQRINPCTHGLPHGLVDMNATGLAIHEAIQEAKLAERAAAAASREAAGGSTN